MDSAFIRFRVLIMKSIFFELAWRIIWKPILTIIVALLVGGCATIHINDEQRLIDGYSNALGNWAEMTRQNIILEERIDSLKSVIDSMKRQSNTWHYPIPMYIPDSGCILMPLNIRHEFLEQMRKDADEK